MMLPGGVAVNNVRFEMESWTGVQRAFATKSFYKNNDSYVAAQREFRKKFGFIETVQCCQLMPQRRG